MSVRVLLVEDHELVRSGIKTMLESDPRVQVVGGAADGAEGVKMARELRPDVILMDISLPVLDGFEATRQIESELPNTKVIILTAHDLETNDAQALIAGAVGYLHKNTNPEELLRAVHTVASGDPFISSQSIRRVLSELHGAGDNGQLSKRGTSLTERDKYLLRCLVRGLRDKEIAREIALSARVCVIYFLRYLPK